MDRPARSLVECIHGAYSSLSGRERRIADVVLESPGEISAYAGSELAQIAGVSNSTVTRFVQKIGFDNYDELRRSAREARAWGSPLFASRSGGTATGGAGEDPIRQFAEFEASLIMAGLTELSPPRLDEIAEALAGATRLFFVGFRNSHNLAGYAHWQFLQFRTNTHLLPGPGETLAERIAGLGKGDLVLVVGMRRLVRDLGAYAETIRDTGASVLLITDPSIRSTPAHANWTITCPVENPWIFDSYAGVLAVLRLLSFATFQKLGKKGLRHLQAIESQHERLGEIE